MKPFPRLNNYTEDATREELNAYVEKVIDWAAEIEDSNNLAEVVCQLKRIADVFESWNKTYVPVAKVP